MYRTPFHFRGVPIDTVVPETPQWRTETDEEDGGRDADYCSDRFWDSLYRMDSR